MERSRDVERDLDTTVTNCDIFLEVLLNGALSVSTKKWAARTSTHSSDVYDSTTEIVLAFTASIEDHPLVAQHVARCDPDTVIRFVRELIELRQKREVYEKELEELREKVKRYEQMLGSKGE